VAVTAICERIMNEKGKIALKWQQARLVCPIMTILNCTCMWYAPLPISETYIIMGKAPWWSEGTLTYTKTNIAK